ncbi:hypothetical protein NL676_001844 [Syzygium grande]|nr:hypothetical protein NL676_001844 [Syzygium grande]
MAVFCFEGFGMTLALEASMKERRTFQKVLAQSFTGIILVYVMFGFFGYMAYGDQTEEIVTLNLPRAWTTVGVQGIGCFGLLCAGMKESLTFPCGLTVCRHFSRLFYGLVSFVTVGSFLETLAKGSGRFHFDVLGLQFCSIWYL